MRRIVEATYGDECWLCHRTITDPSEYSIDHVIPLSLGGDPWDVDNMRPAHLRCNQSRGNRPPTVIDPLPRPSREW